MDAKNGTLIGGVGGAALVAMLLAGPAKMTSTQPVHTTALAGLPAETVGSSSILRATLDQSGPWSALCEEFVTGINDPAANSVVTPGASPKGAEPGASEATIKSGAVESRVPVRNFPAKVDLSQCVPKDDQKTLSTLIATVPDPVRSHMQLEFDRSVAGIVRGAGAADFALQRYWFPWTPSSQQNTQKISEDQRQLRLRQPGILIFRHTEIVEDERLAIFLVSEAPTAGVNRVQFSHALEYVRQLQGDKPSQIRIAGPRFSASLPILEELIKSFTAKASPSGVQSYANFSVYSPSASNDVLMERFVRKLPGVDFLTFQIGDEEMLCSLVATLKSMSYRPEEIATVSEDESAYGIGQEPEADAKQSGNNGPIHKCTATQNLLRLQFPRDLSSIRNAIDEQNPSEESARQLGIPLVPLSLHEQPQNEHDSPPPYATQQAAADLDRELQLMVLRLRENNRQAVVLMASNPLDRLFLLDYLHRSLPDVRLATAESDALMLHRPGYVDLSGTIVLTGAPLLPDARAARWRGKSIAVNNSMAAEFRSTGEEAAFLSVWSLIAEPVTPDAPPEPDPGTILSPDCEFTSLVASDRFLLASSKVIKPLFPCTTLRSYVAGITQHLESSPRLWIGFLMLVFFVSFWHIALMVVNVFAGEDDGGPRGWFDSAGTRLKQFLRWDLYRVARGAAIEGKLAAEKLLLLFVLTNQILLFAYMAFRTTYVNWAPLDESDSLFGTGLIAWFARHGGNFLAGPGFSA